jgi:hypothetical protein
MNSSRRWMAASVGLAGLLALAAAGCSKKHEEEGTTAPAAGAVTAKLSTGATAGTAASAGSAGSIAGSDSAAAAAGSGSAAAGSGSTAGSGSAAAGSNAAATTTELSGECKDYQALVAKVAGCTKLPQAARDAIQQAFTQSAAGWAKLPAEGRAKLGATCKAAADAVRKSSGGCT